MQTDIVEARHRARVEQGVRRYADADKSDPFTFNRCMSHLKNGLCSFSKDGEPQFYDAEAVVEKRVDDNNQEYNVTRYKDIKRL